MRKRQIFYMRKNSRDIKREHKNDRAEKLVKDCGEGTIEKERKR